MKNHQVKKSQPMASSTEPTLESILRKFDAALESRKEKAQHVSDSDRQKLRDAYTAYLTDPAVPGSISQLAWIRDSGAWQAVEGNFELFCSEILGRDVAEVEALLAKERQARGNNEHTETAATTSQPPSPEKPTALPMAQHGASAANGPQSKASTASPPTITIPASAQIVQKRRATNKEAVPHSVSLRDFPTTMHQNTPLTPAEQRTLTKLESIIRRNWASTLDLGYALTTIRDQKLYRGTHKTFAAYCRDRWDLGHSQSYRAIGAVEVLADLSPLGTKIPLPETEGQCRPLLSLTTEDRRNAWETAIENAAGAPVTGRIVEQAAKEFMPAPTETHTPKKSKTSSTIESALALVQKIEKAIGEHHDPATILVTLAELKSVLVQAIICRPQDLTQANSNSIK
jgi:hypothetical protein